MEEEKVTEIDVFNLTIEDRNAKTTKRFESQLENLRKVVLDDFGVYMIYERYNKEKNIYYTYKVTELYKWDSFNISRKYKMFTGTDYEPRFDFELDGIEYHNYNFRRMKRVLYDLFQGSKGSAHISNVLREYTKKVEDISDSISEVIGFTEEGWRLPPDYNFIRDQGIIKQIVENLKIVNETEIDENLAVEYMKGLHQVTTIPYKDIIFAWSVISPFLYALRKHTRLMPILALGGKAGTGKSTMLEMITCKIYGHILAIIGAGVMSSKPRAEAYFASSTFPICLDDCQDLRPFATAIIKTYTTTEDFYTRLNPDQSYKIYIAYCAPISKNFNELPLQFDSSAYRDRTVYLEINEIEKNPEWLNVYNLVPFGYIGKYIINGTSEFTGEDIYKWYYEADDLGFEDHREQIIAKIFSTGADLMKALFGVDLDLSELPKKIKETHELGNEDLIELIAHQIENGIAQEYEIYNTDPNTGFKIPQPITEFRYKKGSWVKHEIHTGKYKKQDGFYININNKNDLEKQFMSFRSPKRLSMKQLTNMLQNSWEDVDYGIHYVDGRRQKSIFIPEKYINARFEEI